MRPPETDVNRIRWLLPGNRISRWVARLTGRMWFIYYDEPTEHYRLYFDDPAKTSDTFFSIPWFRR